MAPARSCRPAPSRPSLAMLRRSFLALPLAALAGRAFAQPQPLTVFAAASLKTALDEAAPAYTRAGGPPVRLAYAASSALARQIEQGAPADVFISADLDWMDYLAQRRLIVATSRRNLLTNRLALIAPKASELRLTVGPRMPISRALGDGRLAVAAPDVPAGKYARAALTALGVWDQVETRLAPAENVRAALAYVSRGEAPLGVVYDTDAFADPNVRIVGIFPERTHPRIVYPAAVIAASQRPEAAAFLRFLQGRTASATFRRLGFKPLG